MSPTPIDRATWFVAIPAWSARAILLALVVILVLPLAAPRALPPARTAAPAYSDNMLYRDVTARVQAGEDYYTAAETEQRAHLYPTTPAQSFHPPTLVYLLAALRTDTIRRIAAWTLTGLGIVALRRRLGDTALPAGVQLPATLLMATGMMLSWWPQGFYMHEAWAGTLIALSLATCRGDRFVAALALGVAACLVRELALPYLAVMAVFALAERRWKEALSWMGGGALICALYAVHLALAAGHHRPGDLASQGWLAMNGWAFAVDAARRNILLMFAPSWLASLAILFAVLGLGASRDRWVMRCAAVVGGYLTAFLFVGRPDNAYWGDLIGPLLPLGWALAPLALADLWRAARGPGATTVRG